MDIDEMLSSLEAKESTYGDSTKVDTYKQLKTFNKLLIVKTLSKNEINHFNNAIPNINYLNGTSWVAGGAIRDTLSNIEYKDIDVYSISFTSAIDFIIANNLLKYEIIEEKSLSEEKLKIIKHIKENKQKYIERPGDFASYLQTNRIYKLDFLRDDNRYIQVMVNQNYNNPAECINSFDLTMCQFAYDGQNLIYFKESSEDLKNKVIKIHKLNEKGFFYPNFKRIMKFIKQGYKLDRFSYDNMITNFGEVLEKPEKAMDDHFNAIEYLNSDSESKLKTINIKNKFYFLELNSELTDENFV